MSKKRPRKPVSIFQFPVSIGNVPITLNPNWTLENAKLAKRPLYIVVIENLPEWLTTFRAEELEITGHGIGGYGINGYGY